jgi:hypothetical protein
MWAGFTDPESTVVGLIDGLPDLVNEYGSAASALGADWYEELRDTAKVAGRFAAIVANLPDLGRTDALARWAVQSLFHTDTPNVAAAQEKVSGGLQRIIANADRETVMGSAVADPKAHGWRRSTQSGACAFCRMVAGRGIIFTHSAGTFACHDHCGCVATPVWGGDGQQVDDYVPTTKNITDADRARVRAYLAANPTA